MNCFLASAELLDGFVGEVAEQRKIEIVLGLEGAGIDGSALMPGWRRRACRNLFLRRRNSTLRWFNLNVGFGIEEEEDALAGEVLQRDGFVFVGFQAKGGSFGADFEHVEFLALDIGSLTGIASGRLLRQEPE